MAAAPSPAAGDAPYGLASCSYSEERVQWAARMRQKFSPPGMLHPDGSIDQEFFRPKAVLIVNDRKWGDPERAALCDGLAKWGVGCWRQISEEFLPQWDDQEVRIRAAKALGSQSLARYAGWRGDRAAVEAEHARNRAIGEATGCWKGGCLVEDEAGSVRRYLEAQAAAELAGGN